MSTGCQKDRQRDRQTARQTDRQKDRQKNRKKDRKIFQLTHQRIRIIKNLTHFLFNKSQNLQIKQRFGGNPSSGLVTKWGKLEIFGDSSVPKGNNWYRF